MWTDGKAEVGRVSEEKESGNRKSYKKEDAGAWKGGKVTKHCVFECFVAPQGRKIGSLSGGFGAIWPDGR